MTTANLSAITSDKQRSELGLDLVADYLHEHTTARVPVVGWIEHHEWKERRATGNVMVMSLTMAEPGWEADGSDPDGVGRQLLDIADMLRKKRGRGAISDIPATDPEPEPTLFDFDGDGKPTVSPEAEVRLTGDGPREVPPPSAEEIQAERAEAKAKGKAKPSTTPFEPGPGAA